MSLLFEEIPLSPKIKLCRANQDQIRNQRLRLRRKAFLQFPAEKSFPLSDLDKIKVIDKLAVADSESDFGLHGKALVSEIFAFYLNKSDIHFCYFFE